MIYNLVDIKCQINTIPDNKCRKELFDDNKRLFAYFFLDNTMD